MKNDYEEIRKTRDAQLRRRILNLLKIALDTGPNGVISAREVRRTVDRVLPSDEQFQDDQHYLRLVREMVHKGYVAKRDGRLKETDLADLETLYLNITEKGLDLWMESIGPDPIIADDRLG